MKARPHWISLLLESSFNTVSLATPFPRVSSTNEIVIQSGYTVLTVFYLSLFHPPFIWISIWLLGDAAG